MAAVNRRLRPRELTPEEQEEREIQEEVFIETSGYSSREEYERHQREIIRDLQECEWEIEQQQMLREMSSSCCPDPQVRGGKCENCGLWISDESELHQGDNEG